MDEDDQCEHGDWQLVELRKARRGLDKVMRCGLCGEAAIELDQAALRDPSRPPL